MQLLFDSNFLKVPIQKHKQKKVVGVSGLIAMIKIFVKTMTTRTKKAAMRSYTVLHYFDMLLYNSAG